MYGHNSGRTDESFFPQLAKSSLRAYAEVSCTRIDAYRFSTCLFLATRGKITAPTNNPSMISRISGIGNFI